MTRNFDETTTLAIDLVLDRLDDLIATTLEFDHEAKTKWLTNRIAGRQFERRGEPPVDSPDSVANACAESIFALSLAL